MVTSLLVIEDEVVLGRNIATYLSREGFEVRLATTGEAGLEAYAERACDLVLVDYQLPGIDGLEVLARLKARDPGARVVVMTGSGDEHTVLAAFRGGAADYLKKPLQLAGLARVVLGQRERTTVQQAGRTPGADEPLPGILGESPTMRRLKALVRRVVDAEASSAGRGHAPSVLVVGETGTGKELVARALHGAGPRASEPFVEINCAAIPPAMLESELFGHERGAFTDARQRRIGLIESTQNGTVFLDEVGCLELGAQAKLLRVLEDRRMRRLGGTAPLEVNARFVAATSADLEQMVRAGTFRPDLYYRLGMLRLRVPPLRERDGDLERLVAHFLAQFGQRYAKPGLAIAPPALSALAAHAWPGNVRELRNVIEQAVIVCDGGQVALGDLDLGTAAAMSGSDAAAATLQPLAQVERELLERALRETGNNVSKAARRLGVSRDTLRYRIRKHGLAAG